MYVAKPRQKTRHGKRYMTRGKLTKIVLAALGASALVLAFATLPGAAAALKPFLRKDSAKIRRDSLERALRRLREQRMIEFTAQDGKTFLAITDHGKKYLRQLNLETLTLAAPKRWGHQWSVILFDIPETKKNARDALRGKLRQLGCMQFHKSVFIHPAPCEDEVDFITETFHIRQYVTVFRTRSLGHQEHRAYRYFQLLPQRS